MKRISITIVGLALLMALFVNVVIFSSHLVQGQSAFDDQQNNNQQNNNSNTGKKKKSKKGNSNSMDSNSMDSNSMNSNTEPNTNGTPAR